jgi:F-type H+-transporting ATPase subunit gamma
VAPVASILIDDFVASSSMRSYMAYTKFINTIRQEPVVMQLLPIQPAEPEQPMAADYIFEPDPQTILGEVLRGLTELQILQASMSRWRASNRPAWSPCAMRLSGQ